MTGDVTNQSKDRPPPVPRRGIRSTRIRECRGSALDLLPELSAARGRGTALRWSHPGGDPHGRTGRGHRVHPTYPSWYGEPAMEHESQPDRARPTFDELVGLTRRVIAGFDEREQRPWGVEASLIELSKQVGDLARHVMMAESYYLPDRGNDPRYAATTEKIGDELANIFYCVIRLADLYRIDLADAHATARRRELDYLGLGDEPPPPRSGA
jgi:hypothetical protein